MYLIVEIPTLFSSHFVHKMEETVKEYFSNLLR